MTIPILNLIDPSTQDYVSCWKKFVWNDSNSPATVRIRDWGGYVQCNQYIEFETVEQLTLFVLRWS